MIEIGLLNYAERLEEINVAASREYALEHSMRKMKEEWLNIEFECSPYRDSRVSILTSLDEIQVLLDDHLIKAQTMNGSIYIKPIEEEMDEWVKKLSSMRQILDLWISVSI